MHVIIFALWGMGMAVELEARQKIIDEYQQAVKPLMTFMPWLEQHSGKESYTVYGGEGIKEHSLSFQFNCHTHTPQSKNNNMHVIFSDFCAQK